MRVFVLRPVPLRRFASWFGVRSRFASAMLISLSVLSGNAIGQTSNLTRNGNNVTLTCDGNFSELQTLCQDGNYCNNLSLTNPPVSSASPQDNVSFSPAATPVDVTWEIINPDTTSDPPGAPPLGNNDNPVAYSIGGIGSFSLLEGVTDVRTQIASTPPPVSISVSHVGGNQQFAVLRYRVKCSVQPGSIQIVKNTTGGDDTFTFNSSIPGGSPNFTITTAAGTGSRNFTNIPPGTYSLSEVVPAGWSFNSLTCTGGGANTSVSGANATVGLDGGETVVCTYANTKTPTTGQQLGSIIVKKVAIGGNASFQFAVSGPANQAFQLMGGGQQALVNLPVGQYTVGESSIPQGWSLQSATCGQGTKQGNAIVVDLDPNETITCTFTNFKEKDEQMEQVTKSFVHRRVDNLLTHSPDRARLLNRLQEQPQDPGLKDGPLKLSGEPGFGQRSGVLGNDRLSLGPTGLTQRGWGEPEFGLSEWERYQRENVSRLAAFSALGASTNFVNDFRFSASLSDLRAKAQAAEAQNARGKVEEAGLGYYASPYAPARTSLRPGLDVWTEGHLSFYEDGTGGIARDGRFSIVYIGADYPLSTRVLFGALAQFDWTKEKVKDPALSGDVGGNGWMAGPYIGIRLAPNLLFDARVAWGTSQNDITLTDPLAGTRTGSFDTTRWLATATLSGNHNYGAWRLSPQAGLAYGAESYDAFHNSLGQIVSGSNIAIGRFTLGSEIGYRFVLHDGSLAEPYIGATGIWNFHSDDLVISGVLVTPNRSRGKVEGGILLRSPSGPSVRAAVSYDGVGDSDFSAITGRVWVGVPFN